MSETILILGASGQIGNELTQKLRSIYGNNAVIASDIKEGNEDMMTSGPFEVIDATDKETILKIVKKYKVSQVYLLAAMLSVTAEKLPKKGWDLNMNSLLGVLDLAKEKHIKQVYWPSSIAVFGPTTPKENTPQKTIMEPNTVYGISKLSGEFWCNYYHEKYGVDVRSIRYPGLISWKTKPGGGTTDYAIDIFFILTLVYHKSKFVGFILINQFFGYIITVKFITDSRFVIPNSTLIITQLITVFPDIIDNTILLGFFISVKFSPLSSKPHNLTTYIAIATRINTQVNALR